MLRKYSKIFILIELILLLFFGYYFVSNQFAGEISKSSPTEENSEFNTQEVEITRVKAETVTPYIDTIGTIEFLEKVNITSRVAGRIEKIFVQEGQFVRKGQNLAQIEKFPLELDLKKQQAAVEAATAQYNLSREQYFNARMNVEIKFKQIEKSELELKRIEASLAETRTVFQGKERLFKEGGISRFEYDKVRTELVTIEASRDKAQKDLEISRIGFRREDLLERNIQAPKNESALLATFIDFNTRSEKAQMEVALAGLAEARAATQATEQLLIETLIRSPLDGYIAARNKSVGEEVNSGSAASSDQAIMVLVDISRIYAVLQVKEADLKKIQPGLSLDLFPGDSNNKSIPATITIVSPVIDARSHTGQVKALFRNQGNHLKPGMFIKGKIKIESPQEIILISGKSLMPRDETRAWVMVVKDKKVFRKEVQTGRKFDEKFEIISGLSSGEFVVTNNPARLREGQEIKPTITTTK